MTDFQTRRQLQLLIQQTAERLEGGSSPEQAAAFLRSCGLDDNFAQELARRVHDERRHGYFRAGVKMALTGLAFLVGGALATLATGGFVLFHGALALGLAMIVAGTLIAVLRQGTVLGLRIA